jgi:hypothetical protein
MHGQPEAGCGDFYKQAIAGNKSSRMQPMKYKYLESRSSIANMLGKDS